MLRRSSVSRRLWVTAAITALGAIASGCAASTPGGASATSSGAPDPDATRIISIASYAAKVNGDAAPTKIEWVRATRGAIAQVMGFGLPAGQQNSNDILILVTGSFTSIRGQPPPAALSTSPPSGRNLEVVVDPNTWATTDGGIGDFNINLSDLGVAHTA